MDISSQRILIYLNLDAHILLTHMWCTFSYIPLQIKNLDLYKNSIITAFALLFYYLSEAVQMSAF